MLRRKIAIALLVTGLGVVASFSTALAWPDQPPVKAYVSGPGIEGQVEITDGQVLDLLKLGGVEDLAWGPISAPAVRADGFRIIRYFDGGGFRFADLTYHPNPNGNRSYAYWEDGPMLEGNHTPYHRQWLYTSGAADPVLIAFLQRIGGEVRSAIEDAGAIQATPDALPEAIKVGARVQLGFTLTPLPKPPSVWVGRLGEEQKTVLAAQGVGEPGHYVVSFVFEQAGEWNWSIRVDSSDGHLPLDIPMRPLHVIDASVVKPADTETTGGAAGVPSANTETGKQNPSPMAALAPPILGILAVGAALLGVIGLWAVLSVSRRPRA